jgi:tetratricopeptide (TPR) repeat protein
MPAKGDLLEAKSYNESLATCKPALEIDSSNPDIWAGRGIALRRLGRQEEAEEAFAKADRTRGKAGGLRGRRLAPFFLRRKPTVGGSTRKLRLRRKEENSCDWQ